MKLSGIKWQWVIDWFGGHAGRARAYEQLLFRENWENQHWTEGGHMILKLDMIAKPLGVSKPTAHRYLKWLSERGFIAIDHLYRGITCRLLIRVLVRPVKRWIETQVKRGGNPSETGVKRYTPETPNTPEYSQEAGNAGASPEKGRDEPLPGKEEKPPLAPPSTLAMAKRPGLSGTVAGAGDRVKAAASQRKADGSNKKPVGHDAAIVWNDVLREWGETPFPVDKKNIPHVKRVLAYLQPDDMDDFRSRLNAAVEWWFQNRGLYPEFKKSPAHPWVFYRFRKEAFSGPLVAPTTPTTTKPDPTPETPPSAVMAAIKTQQSAKPSGGLLSMFTSKKKKYGKGTPSNGEG